MSAESSSLPLVRSGLTTQGTLDWVNLAESSASFTIGVLSRCAGAGVDPYSVLVGQAVAQNLQLSSQGQRNVKDAISNARSYPGFADALWFGFGIRSFVRTLSATDQGMNLLALCSALSECFTEDFAAEVVHQIVLIHKPPAYFTPSTNEWLMIIRACSGVFSSTKFPVLAEGIMRLDPQSKRVRGDFVEIRKVLVRGSPSAEDLAQAIVAVGKVASKEIHSITIVGCAAAGWIGAISEWLFDLSIIVQDSEKNVLYSNNPHGDHQLSIIFDQRSECRHTLDLVSKTYYINDTTQIFRQYKQEADHVQVFLSGRVCWESCLRDSFGTDFERLLKVPMNIGIAIGCAARIMTGITLADPGIPEDILRQYKNYSDSSHGQAFIQCTIKWFPELEECRRHADEAVRFTLLEAKSQYEERIAAIQRLCDCHLCHTGGRSPADGNFCLRVMFETILALSQIISGLNIAESLLPIRAGFEDFYDEQLFQREQKTKVRGQSWFQQIGSLAYTFPRSANRLCDALRLFTGKNSNYQRIDISAISHRGICVYLDTLRDLSLDNELVGKVHVVPGQIERHQKTYTAVEDPYINKLGSPDPETILMGGIDLATMTLMETAHSLKASYVLQCNSLERKISIQVGPAQLVRRACEARGFIYCNKKGVECPRSCGDGISQDRLTDSVIRYKIKDRRILVCDAGRAKEHTRIAALMTAWNPKVFDCIILDRGCFECCFQYSLGLERRDSLIV